MNTVLEILFNMILGKYEGALGHAVLCYKFYLENCGMDDTDVLIRLANVQVGNTLVLDGCISYSLFQIYFHILKFNAPIIIEFFYKRSILKSVLKCGF